MSPASLRKRPAESADPGLDRGLDAPEAERRAEADLERVLTALERGDRVAVGPWRGEVGAEVVLWLPFLRRVVHDHSIDPDQLVAISRGGVRDWYRGIAGSYVDIFELMSVDQYRRSSEAIWKELGGQKQPRLIPFERDLLKAAGAPAPGRWPMKGAALLHPSIMFGVVRRFWKGGLPLDAYLERLCFERWPTPVDDGLHERLPDRYVAVRFYFTDSFPDTTENRDMVRATVSALAEHTPVVLLNTGLAFDDHAELDVQDGPRVLRPLVGVPPERNLGAQAAVVAHADALVGTLGGSSFYPLAYGVPSFAYASLPEHHFPAFIDVARRSAVAYGAALVVLESAQLPNLALLADRRVPVAVASAVDR
jgi:hypothetical protein